MLRWRGSWTAAPGGVAAVSNSGEKFFFLPSPSVFFRSQWLSVLDLVLVFWFRFPSSRFVSVLLSLFGSLSLSPSLLGSLGSLLSLRFFFFIYRGSTGGGPWLVRLQSRNGWSAIDAFGGGGGGEERDAGEFSNFSSLLLLNRGEGRRPEERGRREIRHERERRTETNREEGNQNQKTKTKPRTDSH